MRPRTRTTRALNIISRIAMMATTVISLVARTTPTHVQAASPQALPAIAPARAPNAPNANPGIQFKLVYNPATAVYAVYMKPDTTLQYLRQLGGQRGLGSRVNAAKVSDGGKDLGQKNGFWKMRKEF